ncbi:MAG: hypothetical protein HC856_01605 [Pseudanabaena sp. RU_4_16]|nr:hypothetical protein [Pseudanabaena sp. SU_2_4]NJM27276.1 hypothetical protein [Pseudanabaena sp. RU_4_16]NKB17332.1 hypothetical protein [Pseudanabaena sp. CRU_2_10]
METREKKESKLTHADLEQFTGTTQYYRYSPLFRRMVLTDGTRYLAEVGECYWLFDHIASLQAHPAIKEHPELKDIQFWRLEVREDQAATLTCEWDKGKTVYIEEISFTDFPLDHVRIWIAPTWLENGLVQVALLPSEY